MGKMKYLNLLIVAFILIFQLKYINAQSFNWLKTNYTKVDNGSLLEQVYNFKMSDGKIEISNSISRTTDEYYPLKLEKQGSNSNGLYSEIYISDAHKAPLQFARGKEIRKYNFTYNNSGDLLYVVEAKSSNNRKSKKTYYTTYGYDNFKRSFENSTNNDSRINVEELILGHGSINELLSQITFHFKQDGEKVRSDDGMYYTSAFKNDNNITALISYNLSGTVEKIVFLMPKDMGVKVTNKLISNFGIEKFNGENVIKRNMIKYIYAEEGDVGIIIID